MTEENRSDAWRASAGARAHVAVPTTSALRRLFVTVSVSVSVNDQPR